MTDFEKSKSATGEEICVFHWGVGFLRAVKKCPSELGLSKRQPE
ncbi:MAG: hypothetical protein ACXVIS_06990 [Halobacteriota archaeon]